MCMCMCMYVTAHVYRPEVNLWELGLFFKHGGSNSSVRFGCKRLHPLICLARPVCLTTATEETNANSRNLCPHPVFLPLPLRAACRVELGRVEAELRVGGGAYPQNGRSEVSQTGPMSDGNYSAHDASRFRDCVVARTGGLGASAPRN